MAQQFGTTLRSAFVQAIITAAGTSPKLTLYTGTQPANCGTAASGTLLATLTLNSTMATATAGVLTVSGTPITGTAVATGTAGYYRLVDNAGTTCHGQGTLGTTGTDMIIDNTSITSGQSVQITSWTITAPGA